MSSNPNKKRPREEEDDDNNEVDKLASTPPKAPPGASPPGVRLRSGKKAKAGESLKNLKGTKRLKTGNDGTLAGDDTVEMDDEDEEMTTEADADRIMTHEDDDEDDDQKTPAKPAATSKVLPASGNLRLPLQHTPGRPAATGPTPAAMPLPAKASSIREAAAPSKSTNEIEPPPPQQQKPKQQRMNLVKTPYKKVPDMAVASPTGTEKPLDVTAPPAAAVATQPTAGAAATAQDAPPAFNLDRLLEHPWLQHPLLEHPSVEYAMTQPWAYFVVFGLLMLPSLLIVNPFLDSAVGTSRVLVPFYQYFVGSPKSRTLIIEKKIPSEDTLQLMAESEKLNLTLLEHRAQQMTAWKDLEQAQKSLKRQSEKVEQQLENILDWKLESAESFQNALSSWKKLSANVHEVASASSKVLVAGSSDKYAFSDLLDMVDKIDEKQSLSLLDTWELSIWDPPTESCDFPELKSIVSEDKGDDENEEKQDGETPVVVTREFVMDYWDSLRAELDAEVQGIQTDSPWRSDIEKWINQYIDSSPLPAFDIPEMKTPENSIDSYSMRPSSRGASDETIRNLIDARLEVDRADGTGRKDYAALFQGGSVVRKGSHATSPSLADKLPLLNRVMALMGAQFYGYGPEAALTPSYPVDSLGQCWAFVEEDGNEFGSYAVLTVRLAKNISVQSVSVEHPLVDVAKKSRSAIKQFRVYGYVDADANSEPIDLGKFQFEMNSKKRKIREEFELEGGVGDIPRLAAISLVIDSTWGPNYACLYRFRVHGRE